MPPIRIKSTLVIIATRVLPRKFYREVNGVGTFEKCLQNKATVLQMKKAKELVHNFGETLFVIIPVRA